MFISDDDAWRLLDQSARNRLGISGEEVLRRWDSGFYGPDPDKHESVMGLAIAIPSGRRIE